MRKAFKNITVLITFLFILISHQALAAEIAVIVNASGPLVDAGERDIADIYLGNKRFQDAVKIVPLLYPEGSVKEAFLKDTLRMTPKDYKLYWTKKIFQEGTPLPKTPAGIPEIINTVKEIEGAIGFLPRDMLKDLSGIKVIKVIK